MFQCLAAANLFLNYSQKVWVLVIGKDATKLVFIVIE